MDCAGVTSRLIAYHLAALEDAERDAVDAHLLGCRACLASYLALKHAAERRPSAGAEDRPSPAARARLRAEVARAFARPSPPATAQVVPLLARRIPLYQGLVAAAVAAAITVFVPDVIARFTTHRVPEGVPEVDTARPRAESLHIY